MTVFVSMIAMLLVAIILCVLEIWLAAVLYQKLRRRSFKGREHRHG